MNTAADHRLFVVNANLAEPVTPVRISASGDCVANTCLPTNVQTSTGVHNKLLGIQGGTDDQRWHLSAPQYQAVLASTNPSDSNPFVTLSEVGDIQHGLPPGGLTNQVLAKINNADYNAQWIDAIYNAGSGITITGATIKLGGNVTSPTIFNLGNFSGNSITIQSGNPGVTGQYTVFSDTNSTLAIISPSGQHTASTINSVTNAGSRASIGVYKSEFPNQFSGFFVGNEGEATDGMIIYDDIFLAGLAYDNDYSANFTNRSLVDKAYVDSHITGSTGVNGLTGTTNIGLGGILSNTVTIDTATYQFLLGSDTGGIGNGTYWNLGPNSWTVQIGNGTSRYGQFTMAPTDVQLYYQDTTGLLGIFAGITGYRIVDTISHKGAVYGADYSANFTARSLVDKGYVDGVVGGGVVGPTGPTGQGVPTGGTTGQALVKVNGTDYNTAWATIPAGPTGATGPAGPTGPTGSTGVTGSTGTTGATGPTGAAGATGSAGATGATGPQGAPGTNGTNGTNGATGSTGATGAAGVGVPTGGTIGQVLAKINSTNFNTQWVTPSGGGGTVTGGTNGLALVGANISLGGTLTAATSINTAGFSLLLGGASSTLTLYSGNNTASTSATLLTPTAATLQRLDASSHTASLAISNTGFLIIDNIASKGLVYNADYSANFTDRSIPDVGWVNDQLTSLGTIITGSSNLTFPTTNAGKSSEQSMTVTGAADGDVVSLGYPNVSFHIDSCYTARVSATNTVTVTFNNYSSAAITPTTGLFKVTIFK